MLKGKRGEIIISCTKFLESPLYASLQYFDIDNNIFVWILKNVSFANDLRILLYQPSLAGVAAGTELGHFMGYPVVTKKVSALGI